MNTTTPHHNLTMVTTNTTTPEFEEAGLPYAALLGVGLSLVANFCNACCFILQKQSLKAIKASGGRPASEGGLGYLKRGRWWTGQLTVGVGELLGSVAIVFAPAMLIAPLGVFSIVFNALLSPYFLQERLGNLGQVGCLLTFVGCVIITLCGPKDVEFTSVEQFNGYLTSLPFVVYTSVALSVAIFLMILSSKFGKKNIYYEAAILGCLASIAIFLVKGVGVTVKTTIEGHENGFKHPTVWISLAAILVLVTFETLYCQRALDKYNTTIMMSFMYVSAVSLIIISTAIIFHDSIDIGWKNIVLTIAGFVINVGALYILNVDLNPTLKLTNDNAESIEESDQQTTQFEAIKDEQKYVLSPDSKSANLAVSGKEVIQSENSPSAVVGSLRSNGRNSSFSIVDENTFQTNCGGSKSLNGWENGGFSSSDNGSASSSTQQRHSEKRALSSIVDDLNSPDRTQADNLVLEVEGNYNSNLVHSVEQLNKSKLSPDEVLNSESAVYPNFPTIKEDNNISVVYVEKLYPA